MDVEVKDSTINSFLIEGFQKNIPLIDIFTLLTKQVDDIKKLTFFHDTCWKLYSKVSPLPL